MIPDANGETLMARDRDSDASDLVDPLLSFLLGVASAPSSSSHAPVAPSTKQVARSSMQILQALGNGPKPMAELITEIGAPVKILMRAIEQLIDASLIEELDDNQSVQLIATA